MAIMNFAIDTSGLHPSTTLGLSALTWLHGKTEFKNILDMGCGNGILSVASAHLWQAKVLAVDISENAVRDTQIAVEEYHLTSQITVLRSDRFMHPQIKKSAPYDLIIANQLDQWLIEMVGDIRHCLKKGGYVVTSGLLDWLAEPTKQAYHALGLEIQQEFSMPPWRACVICDRL